MPTLRKSGFNSWARFFSFRRIFQFREVLTRGSFSQQGPKRMQSIDPSECACCCRLSARPDRWHFGTRIHGKKAAPALGTSCPPAHSCLGKGPSLNVGGAGGAVGSWGILLASHLFPGRVVCRLWGEARPGLGHQSGLQQHASTLQKLVLGSIPPSESKALTSGSLSVGCLSGL